MRLIGKIVKPQGVKGELKVYPADNNLDMYKNVKNIYLDNNSNSIKIKKLVLRQGFIYLTLDGVNDRNQAELYRNKKVYTNDNELVLKEDTYYTEDLINADIFDQSGQFIGTILDVDNYGSADVITILEDDREYSVPFLTSIFVCVEKSKIIVNKKKYDEAKICE